MPGRGQRALWTQAPGVFAVAWGNFYLLKIPDDLGEHLRVVSHLCERLLLHVHSHSLVGLHRCCSFFDESGTRDKELNVHSYFQGPHSADRLS